MLSMIKAKIKLQIFLVAVFALAFTACQEQPSVRAINSEAQSKSLGESASVGKSSVKNTEKNVSAEAVGEIKECDPANLTSGETLRISLKTPNGGNLAIVRDKSKTGFFLLSDETKLTQAAPTNPFWNVDELKNISQIDINTASATGVDLTAPDSKGSGKSELIFSREGWYTIELSKESLEQDDAPISGRCRVYFSGKPITEEKVSSDSVLFDFRKDSFESDPKLDAAERDRVLRVALGEETDGMEISSKENGAFTDASRNETAYLIRPDVTSITQDPTTTSDSVLAIFEGDKLIAKFNVGSYFYIAVKRDANREHINELLLVGNNLQMGIDTKQAKLIKVESNKLQTIKDFGTVYENTCEGATVKKKEIRASVISFVVNQNSHVFSSRNTVSPCH